MEDQRAILDMKPFCFTRTTYGRRGERVLRKNEDRIKLNC